MFKAWLLFSISFSVYSQIQMQPFTKIGRAIYPAHYLYKSYELMDSNFVKVKVRRYYKKKNRIIPKKSFTMPLMDFNREKHLAKSVLRVESNYPFEPYSGTAFKVGNRLYLTAAHVLKSNKATGSHQRSCRNVSLISESFNSRVKCHQVVKCNADTMFDYCLIKVNESKSDEEIPSLQIHNRLLSDAKRNMFEKTIMIGNVLGNGIQASQAIGFKRMSKNNLYLVLNDLDKGASGGPIIDSNGIAIGVSILKDRNNDYGLASPSHKIIQDILNDKNMDPVILQQINIAY